MEKLSQGKERRNPLVALVGPTASGKSELAVRLAKECNGEIVSADSRQVYKGMEIGSGQISKENMQGVPHHLLSIASPKRRFTVAQYQCIAQKTISQIRGRGRVPILVGGSPFYVYAVADNLQFPEVPPDKALRRRLEKLSAEELFSQLKDIDSRRVETIEQKNRRRLIRALEIVLTTGKPVPPTRNSIKPWLDSVTVFLGVRGSKEELKERIEKRFHAMLKRGFLREVQNLRASGLSWKRIEDLGLEYREAAQYLQKKISKEAMIDRTIRATQDFARRQMTWFKKDPRIHWVSSSVDALALLRSRGL